MKNYEIHVDEDLRETKAHGSVEYPLSVYHLEFTNVYLGHIRWHWHDEIEFNLVIEGSAQFLIGDRTIQVNKGEAIFINQNILHSVHPMNGIQCKIQVLVFHPAIIFGNGQPYLNANYVLPVLTCNDYIYDVINTTSTLGSDILH